MNRKEHLAWCKQRALEYIDRGNIQEGITSMISDTHKHAETTSSICDMLAMSFLMSAQSTSILDARKFINGYN